MVFCLVNVSPRLRSFTGTQKLSFSANLSSFLSSSLPLNVGVCGQVGCHHDRDEDDGEPESPFDCRLAVLEDVADPVRGRRTSVTFHGGLRKVLVYLESVLNKVFIMMPAATSQRCRF